MGDEKTKIDATANLNAEFNRWTISSHDFDEAHDYLKVISQFDNQPVVQRALLSAAIIAYCRPFMRSDGQPDAAAKISLPSGFFDAERMAIHDKVIYLRNRGVAHSDFAIKPTSRVPTMVSGGVLTWSKPFDPLSEGIKFSVFQEMAWRLHVQCSTEMLHLEKVLAREGEQQPAPEGAVIRMTIPLSEFSPKKKD